MATVRELLTKWSFDVDTTAIENMDAAIDNAKKSAREMGRTLSSVAQSTANLGKTATVALTVPLAAAGTAMAKIAIDAEETQNKFGAVFGEVEQQANAATKNLVDNFGLSSTAAKGLLSDTGDLLSGFGITGESALALSADVQALAVDLASFTNFEGGAKGASEALTKALLGERESVKALGIAILESDVKAKVKALDAAGRFTNETERQKKAIATLAIAQEQSKNAIGDFERSAGSTAQEIRLLQRDLSEVALDFGNLLIPLVRDGVAALRSFATTLRNLSPEQRETILNFAKMAFVVGPLLFTIGKMVSGLLALQRATQMVSMLTAAFKTFGTTALLANLKAIAIPALIVAAIALVILAVEDFVGFMTGKQSLIGDLLGDLSDDVRNFFDFSDTLIDLSNWLDELWTKFKRFTDFSDTLVKIAGFVTGDRTNSGQPAFRGASVRETNAATMMDGSNVSRGRGGRRGRGGMSVTVNATNNLPANVTQEQMDSVNKQTADGLGTAIDDVIARAGANIAVAN